MSFIRRSFEPLFGDWRYLLLLYTSGSLVLGTIGYLLQQRGFPVPTLIWLLVLLALPFHFSLYGIRESWKALIQSRISRRDEQMRRVQDLILEGLLIERLMTPTKDGAELTDAARLKALLEELSKRESKDLQALNEIFSRQRSISEAAFEETKHVLVQRLLMYQDLVIVRTRDEEKRKKLREAIKLLLDEFGLHNVPTTDLLFKDVRVKE